MIDKLNVNVVWVKYTLARFEEQVISDRQFRHFIKKIFDEIIKKTFVTG